MNAKQRELIIERDHFACVFCTLSGERCPLRGKNDEPCKLLSPSLGPARYWKMDALRPTFQRLQVDHINGRVGGVERTESWDVVWTLCPCCHSRKSADVKEVGSKYAAAFAGMETAQYLAALAEEAAAAPKRRSAKAKLRQKTYQKAKQKAGGKSRLATKKPKPTGLKLPQRVLDQKQRPVLNGTYQPPAI